MFKRLFDHHPDDLPDVYVATADGRCMEPELRDRQKLLFSRSERYRPGDFVLLFRRRELVPAGEHQLLVKRLISAPSASYWRTAGARHVPEPLVVVEMLNPAKVLVVPASHLLGIHKCLGPVPVGMTTRMMSDAALLDRARQRAALKEGAL